MKSSQAKALVRTGGGALGLLAILGIVIAVNVIASRVLLRADLTEEKLYTLSAGTRRILGDLDRTVVLKLYFNRSDSSVPMPIKSYAQRVEDLLREYERAAAGRVVLETYDPEPDSDAEEWAQRYGLAPQSLGMMGPQFYMGLVLVAGDETAAIATLDPRGEELLEYELSRAIHRITHPDRPVLGVLSSLPVMGGPAMPMFMPGQRPEAQEPWIAFRDLGQDYEVRQVEPTAESIADEVKTLVVVHPKELSKAMLYAIDQFVLRGGRLLAFVDPVSVVDMQSQGQARMFGGGGGASSGLGELFEAWGITYDPGRIVADLGSATLVPSRNNQAESSPVYLSLAQGSFGAGEATVAGLDSLLMGLAGGMTIQAPEGVTATPLITSSAESLLVDGMMAQFGMEAIRSQLRSEGGQPYTLAARLSGTFKTAFPDGKPAPEPEAGETNAPAPSAEGGLKASAEPTTIIVVADVDMLYDPFCVREMNFFGSSVYQPANDNLSFFAAALELLTGSRDLTEVRTRGKIQRPFTRVQALERKAEKRWLTEEQALQEKVSETQRKLAELEGQKDEKQRYILSPEQEKAIRSFRAQMAETQRQLKVVRRNLREDIERLGRRVKVINIALMPAVVIVAGLGFGLSRRIRARD